MQVERVVLAVVGSLRLPGQNPVALRNHRRQGQTAIPVLIQPGRLVMSGVLLLKVKDRIDLENTKPESDLPRYTN